MGENGKNPIEDLVELFLVNHGLVGDNFIDTPRRVARFWSEFFHPRRTRVRTFPLRTKPSAIVLRGVVLWGFCPHHILPIKFTFKIGYIPETKPLGASKPIWMAQELLALMPLQEELPQMLVEKMKQAAKMKGAGVVVVGEHLCMQMRGVKQPCADMVTDYLTGCFFDQPETRQEFMLL